MAAFGLLPANAQIAGNVPETSLPAAVIEGIPSKPLGGQSSNTSNNTAAAGGHSALASPVPGSMVVRVNARIVFYAATESSSLDKTPGTGPGNTGAAKLNPLHDAGLHAALFRR
jgi:hypothetical protein